MWRLGDFLDDENSLGAEDRLDDTISKGEVASDRAEIMGSEQDLQDEESSQDQGTSEVDTTNDIRTHPSSPNDRNKVRLSAPVYTCQYDC